MKVALLFLLNTLLYSLALAQDSNDGILITEAQVAMDKYKDYQTAVKTLNKVSTEGQQNPLYSFYLAKAYEGLGDDENTLKYYLAYSKRIAASPEVMTKIAELKYKVDKASSQAQDSQISVHRSKVYYDLSEDNIQEAILTLKRLEKSGNADSNDYLNLVLANAYTGNDDEVIQYIKKYSSSTGNSYQNILSYYIMAKYFKKSFFQNIVQKYFNDDGLNYLKSQIEIFTSVSGNYAPGTFNGVGDDYGSIINSSGFITVAFDDDLNCSMSGDYSYKYKSTSPAHTVQDGSGTLDIPDQKMNGNCRGSISKCEIKKMKISTKINEYIFSSFQCTGIFSSSFEKRHNTEEFSLSILDNNKVAVYNTFCNFLKK